MLFPCKKCVCLSICKAVAAENIKSQDKFYKITLSKAQHGCRIQQRKKAKNQKR